MKYIEIRDEMSRCVSMGWQRGERTRLKIKVTLIAEKAIRKPSKFCEIKFIKRAQNCLYFRSESPNEHFSALLFYIRGKLIPPNFRWSNWFYLFLDGSTNEAIEKHMDRATSFAIGMAGNVRWKMFYIFRLQLSCEQVDVVTDNKWMNRMGKSAKNKTGPKCN